MINAMSIDVEDYYQVENFKGIVKQEDWEKFDSTIEKNTYKIIEILDKYQVKSTFFILGWIAERHTTLVKDIYKNYHEIASHGYSHNLIYNEISEIYILKNKIKIYLKGRQTSFFSELNYDYFKSLKFLVAYLDKKNYYPEKISLSNKVILK